MHQEDKDSKERKKLQNQAKKKVSTLYNFVIGDYVLFSRVDQVKKDNKLQVT